MLLHLGYGGIESATINTANSLCDDYDIEIMSFYKLSKTQANKLNDKIKVKYLYDEAESIAFDIHADKEYGCLSISKQYFLDEYIKRYIKIFEGENGVECFWS